jgi:uncharacterized membrane protein YhaH (DUF805 family)
VRGEVLTYDDGSGAGIISGDDGNRYAFSRADLQQLTPLRAGMKVDFVPSGDAATDVIVVAGQPAAAMGGAGGGGQSLDWRSLFLDAKGRIGRKDYWIGFIILFVAGLVLGMIPMIGVLFSLAAIYFGVCVASKRLHDMGKSGWLAAIPYGVMFVATVVSSMSLFGGVMSAGYGNEYGMAAGFGSAMALSGLAMLINLGFLLWLGLTAGDPGDNAYGPPPRPLANI